MNSQKDARLSGQTERAKQNTDYQAIKKVVGQPFLAHIPASAQPKMQSLQRSPEGERYCKRCRTHGKDIGGRFLQDALRRPFFVCQRCCDHFNGRLAT